MNVSYRQMKGFLLVARLGSFTRAAEQLHITQAGLSAMMRDLETQFDCRLFDRTTRSVSLTKEGASLIASAEMVVNQIDAASATVKLSTSAAKKIITIAVTPVFASTLAPAVCRAFAAIEPGVEVRIRDVPRHEIQGLVERAEADIGFGIFLKAATGTEILPLLDFDLVLITPAGTVSRQAPSRTQPMRTLPWSKLPALPLISLSNLTPVQAAIDACLPPALRGDGTRQVCNSMQTVVAMVQAGFGAAVLPSLVVPACPADRFDVVRLVRPATRLQFHQMTKKGHQLLPSVTPFVRTLVEIVERACTAQPLH